MSVNSLYPGTTNGVCVTSIIKDKIREYMMNDSTPFIKSSIDVLTSDINKENELSSLITKTTLSKEQTDAKKQRSQEAVSTTNLGLPSSLDINVHNSCEPCPHSRQELVTASARRLGNSLDALLHESKKASSHIRAIKNSPPSIITANTKYITPSIVAAVDQRQNTDRLFISSDHIRYRKDVTLHDICEEYIQFITVNSTESPDEQVVTTTSENEFEASLASSPSPLPDKPTQAVSLAEAEIGPVCFPFEKRIAQISVITVNENLSRNSTTIVKQSVEETHVNTENECEKSNGESESSTDKFTSEVDSDKRDEHFSSAVNGMKSAAITPADKNPISDFEEPVEKEESEEIVTDNVTAVLSNGINHDVGEDSQEKIEEKVDENILQSAEVEGHSPESDCVSEEKDNEVVTRMETDEIPSTDVKENQEERAETIMNDESADSKDIEPNEEVSVEKFEQRDEIEEIVISAPSPTSVEIAKSPDNLKTEIPDVEAADEENITKNVLAEVEQKNDCKEDETADVEKKPEVVQSESNVKTISKKNSQNSEKECSKEGIANITGIAVKRRAEIVDEVEPDREGGISSSSSSSSSGSGSEAENTQDCKRIRFDESIFEEDERERLIREFVERSTESSEEIGKNCDKLQHEIAALSDLARDKELEWNSIMRLLKLKEEMLERILFKKRHLECQNKPDFEANLNKIYKNLVSSSSLLDQTRGSCTPASINNHVTVVPINPSTSANNGMLNASSQEYYKAIMNSSMLGTSDALSKLRPHRPILPKPPVSSSCSSVSQQPFQSSFLSHSHSTSQSGAQSLMQSNSLIVDQNSIIGEGRQGAIVDVKSIIADFRSKNPDSLPRRGRRTLPFSNRVPDMGIGPRFLPNTALLSMANMALGSGSHVRTSVSSTTHNDHRPNNFLLGQDGSGPSSVSRSDLQLRQANIDSLMLAVNSTGGTFPVNCNQSNNSINCNSNINTTSNNNSANCSTNSSTISSNNSNNNNNNNNNNSNNNSSSNNNNNNSFQEALVKFAKMNEKRDMSSNSAALHVSSKKSASHLPPPPPYPEVTLHPVVVTQSSGSSPVHNSLLHGILTKSNNGCNREHQASVSSGNSGMSATTVNNIQHRPTTFSPTLAKLLTAPERSRTNRSNVSSSNRNPKTTLSEILNSKKTRTEVTITPVTTTSCSSKSGSNVVLVDDDDESETADRLVIDEGREVLGDSTSNVIPADQVPECQGCHKKAAQFVCAGCGNQWYCSRECQVHAWEEHSEMCSG